MIKELIKKQIKKTGTYREVEIETQKLEKQIQTLDQVRQTQITALEKQLETSQKDKNQLNNQIEPLQKDMQALKKERPRLLGYSMKSRPRGVSADVGKPVILKYIL